MSNETCVKGKAVIVTGAGRGIGRAIARRLGVAGANVAIAARTHEQLDETRKMVERAGGRILAVAADVSQPDDVQRVIDETLSVYGRIDALVNNAGTAPLATIDQMEPHVFDTIVDTNVRTVYLCSRGVWRAMADGGGGAIVNISSLAAYDPFPGFAAYGAAKAFVVADTMALGHPRLWRRTGRRGDRNAPRRFPGLPGGQDASAGRRGGGGRDAADARLPLYFGADDHREEGVTAHDGGRSGDRAADTAGRRGRTTGGLDRRPRPARQVLEQNLPARHSYAMRRMNVSVRKSPTSDMAAGAPLADVWVDAEPVRVRRFDKPGTGSRRSRQSLRKARGRGRLSWFCLRG